ncbi:MAG: ABC transporter substrate-binding protein [Eubacteriaceae bacterium]|jgi:putative aldouronate transport system substrate-binding protein
MKKIKGIFKTTKDSKHVRSFGKKTLCAVLITAMLLPFLAGCGSKKSSSATVNSPAGGPYDTEITIDVFDSQANFQGLDTGWFAKIVKDKFNMNLNIIAPNVAGGGDSLYQTRSANGNLGDLIITNLDKNRLNDMVSAGLVADMSDYIGSCDNLQKYKKAIEEASTVSGQDGMWAVPSEISNQSATEPCEATDPTNAPSLRWDLYEQVGSPTMNTLEDSLGVLQQMQNAAGTTDSGKQVYAFSLMKDWDDNFMQNAGALTSLYGYEAIGFAMGKADGSAPVESIIDDNSQYVRALKYLFNANQMGLVDPESTTQNFDQLQTKYKDGQVLYSFWPWLGAGQYNTTEHTSQGKGFATATIQDMKCLSFGSYPMGKMEVGIMIGSEAQDPQRMADFIDWLYSPEGIFDSCAASGSTAGPEGLTWEMKDGQPVLTDFGKQAFVDVSDTVQVPSDWGSGTWKDGISKLNYKAVGLVDTDPDGVCYNYQRWDDYTKLTQTKLSEDWSSKNDNATSAISYLENKNMLTVTPGTNYAVPDYSTDISAIKEQCKQVILEDSWKMVFAADEAEFNSDLKDMQDTVNGLGYDQVYQVDKGFWADKIQAAKTAESQS